MKHTFIKSLHFSLKNVLSIFLHVSRYTSTWKQLQVCNYNIIQSYTKFKNQTLYQYKLSKKKFPEFTSPMTLLFDAYFFYLCVCAYFYISLYIYIYIILYMYVYVYHYICVSAYTLYCTVWCIFLLSLYILYIFIYYICNISLYTFMQIVYLYIYYIHVYYVFIHVCVYIHIL